MAKMAAFERTETAASSAGIVAKLIAMAGREVWVHSAELSASLWEDPDVLDNLRRHLTERPHRQLKVLLVSARDVPRNTPRFLALAQRLSSLIEIREVTPEYTLPDRDFVVTDMAGVLKLDMGDAHRGVYSFDTAADARQLSHAFEAAWAQARPCSELRALGA